MGAAMKHAAKHESMPHGARMSMQPIGLVVCYRDVEDDILCVEERKQLESFDDETIDLHASYDGEVIRLAVTPRRPVKMEYVQVQLRHAFSSHEMMLMNGYQSWTDTRERLAWERIKGLRGVPSAVVKRYAIDGGGDYGMVDYSAKRGWQHGFTYATFRRDEGMVLVGSLDESQGFALLQANAAEGSVTLQTECPNRAIEPGEQVTLGSYAIVRGHVDECYDRWFELAGITARPVRPLVGYTSWYRHYGDIDEAKLQNDLEGMVAQDLPGVLQRLDAQAPSGDISPDTAQDERQNHASAKSASSGAASPPAHGSSCADEAAKPLLLFQIDDGYCKVGDWLEVDQGKFPRGLAPLAAEIREAGFMPGLWVAPYLCEKESRLFRERPEWLLRDEKGEPVPTGPQWSGGYALDTRNTEVRSYVLDVLRTMTRDWGFGLLKVDFLYAACMQTHDGLNHGQLMADAIDLLRKGAGEDTLILGCGVPLGSVFGRVDYCRIGCDVGLDWDDKLHMRLLHRERVSTKNSMGNTLSRQPLDGRAFGNDPDVFFLRDDVSLSQAQRDRLLQADATSGSVFLTSDDMGLWNDRMRQSYEEALSTFIARFR